MSASFTPEQEARVAEIVGKVLAAVDKQRAVRTADDAHTAASWVAQALSEGSDA